jgi:hypothetical protein
VLREDNIQQDLSDADFCVVVRLVGKKARTYDISQHGTCFCSNYVQQGGKKEGEGEGEEGEEGEEKKNTGKVCAMRPVAFHFILSSQ